MTGDSALPEQGAKGRARLRAEWRAESTWRRHEIAGKLKDLQRKMDEKKYMELLGKVAKVLDEQSLPLTVRKKLEASLTIEHEKPSLEEPKNIVDLLPVAKLEKKLGRKLGIREMLCTCNDAMNFAGKHGTCEYIMNDGRKHKDIPQSECNARNGCLGSG